MATPRQFFDPFSDVSHHPPHSRPADGENDIKPIIAETSNKLLIKGQGTIAVKSTPSKRLRFTVETEDGTWSLNLVIDSEKKDQELRLYASSKDGKHEVNLPWQSTNNLAACLLNKEETTYWLSIDRHHGRIRYGKYYTNNSMTLLQSQLKQFDEAGNPVRDKHGELVWKPREAWFIVCLSSITVVADEQSLAGHIMVQPLPVVIDLPPFVRSADEITLKDLAEGFYTAPANLPHSCQKLYGNIAGAEIVLDDDDFPDFSKAIQRSCTDHKLWGYTTLKKKAGEFGGFEETYLRITLGNNLGDSPGIPYVLEIWPFGHNSPVHDHGNACAVIKVLHGEICCTWYDSLGSQSESRQPCIIRTGRLEKGAITWIGDNIYQVHQLHNDLNPSREVCCTIQCYRYSDTDNVHYDGFNWRNNKTGKIAEFLPNSDMDFMAFRKTMKEEWKNRSKINAPS